ncbi:MAG: rhodanese-like domain-containing protein [Bdellovibrionota bacterium]
MSEVILDVRERDEFEAEHIEGSINIPLSHFMSVAPGVLNQLRDKNVTVMCRSGNRAKLAAGDIAKMGYADKVTAIVFEGGILEWKKQGKPTVVKRKGHLPILRQVQLIAGALVFTSTMLGAFISPWFLAVSAFVGAGLMVAGSTGFCGMAQLLAFMPWNKTLLETKEELCQVSPKSGCCE